MTLTNNNENSKNQWAKPLPRWAGGLHEGRLPCPHPRAEQFHTCFTLHLGATVLRRPSLALGQSGSGNSAEMPGLDFKIDFLCIEEVIACRMLQKHRYSPVKICCVSAALHISLHWKQGFAEGTCTFSHSYNSQDMT